MQQSLLASDIAHTIEETWITLVDHGLRCPAKRGQSTMQDR